MIGLDTNILLRLFDLSDKAQSQTVEAIISEIGEAECFVNNVVICEFIWTLKKVYKFNKQQILDTLSVIIHSSEFLIENRQIVETAMALYSVGKADYSDYYIGALNQNIGCETTLTFDKKANTASELFRSPIH